MRVNVSKTLSNSLRVQCALVPQATIVRVSDCLIPFAVQIEDKSIMNFRTFIMQYKGWIHIVSLMILLTDQKLKTFFIKKKDYVKKSLPYKSCPPNLLELE